MIFIILRPLFSVAVALALGLIIGGRIAVAANSGVTYHGRIVKPDGTALQGASVQFKLAILSPDTSSCLLYEEVQTLNMNGSNGVFSVSLDDGSGTRTDSTGLSFDNVFSNRNAFSSLPSGDCASGTSYTPGAGDGRALLVSFRDETMSSFESMPAQELNFASMAIQAKSVAGFAPQNLLRFDDSVISGNLNTSPLNNTQYSALVALINGSSTQYVHEAANGTGSIPVVSADPGTTSAGQIWYNSTTNTLEYSNGTTPLTIGAGGGGGISSITAGTGLTANGSAGGSITTSGTLAIGLVPVANGGTGATTLTGAGIFTNGGNAFGAPAKLGPTDANSLSLLANGAPQMTIATSGWIGIGTSTPASILNVFSPNGGSGLVLNDEQNTVGSNAPAFIGRHARDNSGLPSATLAGDYLASFGGRGYGATGWSPHSSASVVYLADENFTDTAHGTHIELRVTPIGSTISTVPLYISSSGTVGIGTATPTATLQVNGEIQAGNSGLACSSTTKGAMRYNNSTSMVEFCNGSTWTTVGVQCSGTTPTAFSFSALANQSMSTLVTSSIVQVNGLGCTVSTAVSGSGSPAYRICSDSGCATVLQGWTTSPSSIASGQYIQLELTTSSIGGQSYSATMIVGNGASVWTASTTGSCTGLPSSPPPIGTMCADGTIYAGTSPDTSAPMFTTPCDYGITWNGTACTGARVSSAWDTYTGTYTATSETNNTTGQANTVALIGLTTVGGYADAPYPPAQDCNGLSTAGITQGSGNWYLPSGNELAVLYTNASAIGNFSGSGYYWSSSEVAGTTARTVFMANGTFGTTSKTSTNLFRCVRR